MKNTVIKSISIDLKLWRQAMIKAIKKGTTVSKIISDHLRLWISK